MRQIGSMLDLILQVSVTRNFPEDATCNNQISENIMEKSVE